VGKQIFRNFVPQKVHIDMTLHIFNPDHELAMASDLDNFTPPRAARRLHADLGFIPALWAADGDKVLVDNIEFGEKAYGRVANRMGKYGARATRVDFVTPDMLRHLAIDSVDPWGWNTTLRNYLIRHGVNVNALPSLDTLSEIRLLSHRFTASQLLASVVGEGMVGEMSRCFTRDEVAEKVGEYGRAVIKAPWSCSGRGIRFVTPDTLNGENLEGWMRNMLANQGCLMVEPYYNKVKDFGMEFRSLPDGHVEYLGLSLFKTLNGAYTGNILATEKAKEEKISRYVAKDKLDALKQNIVDAFAKLTQGRYVGHFGIDMMIVARDDRNGFAVHPCVEINLRRTMGHVALGISPDDDEVERVMRISVGMSYVLKINGL